MQADKLNYKIGSYRLENEIINPTVQVFYAELIERKLKINVCFLPMDQYLFVDEFHIQRILINLFIFALQHTKSDETISVKVSNSERMDNDLVPYEI